MTQTLTKRRRSGRKGISLADAQTLVKTRAMFDDSQLIFVVEPNVAGVSAHDWIASNAEQVQQWIHQYGAVMFRGFSTLKTDEDFIRVTSALPFERLAAELFEESTPRRSVGPGIYTTTAFPEEETIALHSDYSPSMVLAEKLTFFCNTPSPVGGQTPFADCRRILQRLDPEVAESFRRLGWRLVRNYRPELGLSWEDTFYGKNKAEIEVHCKERNIELRWIDGIPQTSQTRAAVIEHPTTGEECWFNHVSFWHMANLPTSIREGMLAEVGIDGLPFNTFYGDGSEIPTDVAHHIRDVLLAEKRQFNWQQGDLVIADNILTCHGREPFSGERAVRVSLFEKHIRPAFHPHTQHSAAN